jgi:hypothetical protein
MPDFRRWTLDSKDELIMRFYIWRWQGIESLFTPAAKDDPLQLLILRKKDG